MTAPTSRSRFRQLLDQAPDEAPAIEFAGSWTTWGTLRAVARSLETALLAHTPETNLRVGLVMENRPEHIAVLIALLAGDHTVVSFSSLQPPARLGADITRAEVPVLVGTAAALGAPGVREAADDALVLELEPTTVRPHPDSTGRVARPGDRNPGVAIEMLTSGTTGPPKRVDLSDRQFDAALHTSVAPPPADRIFRSGVTVVCTPIVHISGLWGSLGPLYAGRSLVLFEKFDLDSWVDAIARHRPRAAGIVPAALRAVLQAEVPAESLSSLEVIISGTTFCPPELVDAFLDRYGIRILPTYGATEFAGAVAVWTHPLHEKWWSTKAGAAGRPLPGVSVRIVDPQGDELATGETGLLEVRSAQSAAGAHAWQRTSDLAAVDTDGFLWIRGRADDSIVRGGFKIAPRTVQTALERHPSVREAAVAPLPDERLGAIPVAAVELEPGRARPTGEELRRFSRDHLLPYEVPAHVVVLDALPRTPSSKVSRVELLDLIAAASEPAVST